VSWQICSWVCVREHGSGAETLVVLESLSWGRFRLVLMTRLAAVLTGLMLQRSCGKSQAGNQALVDYASHLAALLISQIVQLLFVNYH
jgi:hypothetical protein